MTETAGRFVNRKQTHRLGFVSWHMFRPLASGMEYQYVVHFTPEQIAKGRKYLADRLRSARRQMAESIKART